MTERETFEAWISSPPFEREVGRWPSNGVAWPGQYREDEVELAWCAWQAAIKALYEESTVDEVRRVMAERAEAARLAEEK